MTVEEIKANQDLMTSLIADEEIATKVKDNLMQSGFKILTESDIATISKEQIDEAVRINHELVERSIFEASGIKKPVNTKSNEYAKMVAEQLRSKNAELQQELEKLKGNPKPKDKVADELENQEIATLRQQIEALQKINEEKSRNEFNLKVQNEINSLELIMPKATTALFNSEFEFVEADGKKAWRNKETGQFMLNNESAAPMTVAEIIKASYPDAIKKEQDKRTGLDISKDKNISVDAKNDYTVAQAIDLLSKKGITKTNPEYQTLLKQMTANSPEFKKPQ